MKDATFSSARLLALYDRISDAEDAIPRLRRFVLDLAVRGKLLEQEAQDEPAAELLKRIAQEKAQLVKAGEIKNPKPLPPVEDDADFEVPPNWVWTRLGIITSYIQRGKSPKYAVSDGALVVSQKCVQWSGLDLSVAKQVTLESLGQYEDIRFLRDGDLLWNSTGTGTIGRIIRIDQVPEKLVCDSHVTVVRSLLVDPEYIRLWVQSDHVYAQIEGRAAGSTNQVELTGKMAINQVIPLPPLAEQHRIVAKVDELMALCDQLEQARAGREAVRDRLTTASLARLTAHETDAETSQSHARFALKSLPTLTTRPDQIKTLRQTILNLAVRGKLVEQDGADEPASELLKWIAKEKAELVKSGEIRRSKPLAAIDTADSPFATPRGWEITRLGTVIHLLSGQHLQPPEYSETPGSGVPYITGPSDFTPTGLAISRYALVRKAVAKSGQLLLTVKGSGVGKTTICDIPEVAISRQLMSLTPIGWSVPFLEIITHRLAEVLQSQARSLIPGIAREDVEGFVFPFPPLAEQHRIVAKVDALMALCDQLEASLTTATTSRSKLLEALLHEALASDAVTMEAAE